MNTIFKKLAHIHSYLWAIIGGFVVLVAALGVLSWIGYGYVKELKEETASLSTHIAFLEENLASTTALLEASINETETSLASALNEEREKVSQIKSELGGFQQEVGSISGTVSTLEKLSKTDAELLQKYSKVFFLNEHYAPDRLTEVPDEYDYYEYKHNRVHAQMWPYLKNMLDDAKADGIELYIYSAFRSFNEQGALKGSYAVTYGEGTANQFSADQGYSEHQLGTTVDIITPGIGGTLEGFETTQAYRWLRDNAHRYGFVLSYPQDNGHYVFEPWHWRFVGVQLATDLHNAGKQFYDMDQREIDEYLVNIFD